MVACGRGGKANWGKEGKKEERERGNKGGKGGRIGLTLKQLAELSGRYTVERLYSLDVSFFT